jgi:hypothetical protein
MVRRAHDRHTANGRPCQAFRPVPIALMADVRGERVASERADRNACPPQVSLLTPEGKVKRFLRQPLVRGVTPAKVCETVQLSSGSAVYAGSHDVLSLPSSASHDENHRKPRAGVFRTCPGVLDRASGLRQGPFTLACGACAAAWNVEGARAASHCGRGRRRIVARPQATFASPCRAVRAIAGRSAGCRPQRSARVRDGDRPRHGTPGSRDRHR